MGFWLNGPFQQGCHGPLCAGWLGPTALLCIYGFCSMMRPVEPFMMEFLMEPYKNITTWQANRQIFPVWTYSTLILLVPVFLVTDFLRYKPVIVMQGLSYVVSFLLLLFGSGVRTAQLAFFIYSLAQAGDVGYFSYIYCVALLTSLFLPMPQKSLFFSDMPHSGSSESNSESSCAPVQKASRALRTLVLDCKECFSSTAVLFFCLWQATGRCGFYQVSGYVQILWASLQPQQNFTAYNGGVDSIATLSGAAATIAVGHVTVDWSLWGELFLGSFSVLIAATLYLMEVTRNIWVSYSCYILFKIFYMQLITMCTFQIAQRLSRERYALVFGVDSFVGTALQSILTAVVINSKKLQLTIFSQFFVYACYFAALGVLYLVRGVYTVHRVKHNPAAEEDGGSVPEESCV